MKGSKSTALAIPGAITPTSLSLPPGLTFEQWESAGKVLQTIEGAFQWWIGDWLNYGEHAYGEKYAQAVDESQAQTWRVYASVAKRYEMLMRINNVPWIVHRRFASIEDLEQRQALLRRADKEGWTDREAREYVGDLHRVKAPPLPPGKFFVVYADPPWEFRNSGFEQSAAQHYQTMPTDDICKMDVHGLVDSRAALFLWVPNSMLPDALRVADAWGFEYKTDLIWVKDRAPGMGFYVTSKHETLLLAVRGDNMLPSDKPDSVFEAPVQEHSRKPDTAYEIIESMYSGPYVELFARRPRAGWEGWGDQLGAQD